MRPMTTMAVAGVLLFGGCAAGEGAQLDTIPPTSATVGPLPTLPETTAAATTEPAPTATLPDGVIGLSADGPWTLVDSAPGITTPGLVYELMPGLWVYLPLVEDIPNGISWTFNEADRPIIEAYLQAKLVYFKAVTSNPIDLDNAGWAEWFANDEASNRAGLEERRNSGQTVDLDVGVVLRPQVIGDDRSDAMAIVFDCVLDGSVFRTADGSLSEGSSIGVGDSGSAFRLEFLENHWIVTETGRQPSACA